MAEQRTNGHISSSTNNNNNEQEPKGDKVISTWKYPKTSPASGGGSLLDRIHYDANTKTNPITPPQSWIGSMSSPPERRLMIQKFSHDQTDGSNSNGVAASNNRASNYQINCAYCGTTGDTDKHFAKSNRKEFCSINCLKAATKKIYEIPASTEPKKKDLSLKLREVVSSKVERGLLPERTQEKKKSETYTVKPSSALSVEITRQPQSATSSNSDPGHPEKKKSKMLAGGKEVKVSPSPGVSLTYNWNDALESEPLFVAAPVSSFKLAPARNIWENVRAGMKLEVENMDVAHAQIAFWVASVIKIQGYKVLLRFEGFGQDSSRDFWVNLCSPDVHPVGWCATQNQPLIPPTALTARYTDWRDYLVKRLTGARTIPQNFQDKISASLKSKLCVGSKLEIVDKNRICRVRYATVISSIGKRLHLIYYDEDGVHEDFWCHESSSLIHPCGWAQAVGQELYAPSDYHPASLEPHMKSLYSHLHVEAGMKLEAIDPLNLSVICAATVKKVLRFDYIMVRVDCYEEDANGSDWFCYHLSSTSLFPCGFCVTHNIPLTPPHGYTKESFNWSAYFQKTKSKPAPLDLIPKDPVSHSFNVGMRLEVADLMDPRLICVATIGLVVGNLVKIHFDGWEEEYDQWLDAASPDMYPLGWCELVGHKLEAPPLPQPQVVKKPLKSTKKPKKRPTSKQMTEPNLKKRKISSSPRISSPLHHARDKLEASRTKPNPVPAFSSVMQKMSFQFPKHRPVPVSTTTSVLTPKKTIPTGIPFMQYTESPSTKPDPQEKLQTENIPAPLSMLEKSVDTQVETFIPRLVDSSPSLSENLDPQKWSVDDVSKFLLTNDCGAHCDSFVRNKVDGPKLLHLAKESIIVLTGMKVGPAVKILDLISQLTRLLSAAKGRKLSPT